MAREESDSAAFCAFTITEPTVTITIKWLMFKYKAGTFVK
jgi:hypothetical protein